MLVLFSAVPSAQSDDFATQFRRPIALELSADGAWLYAANRDSGTVSVISLDYAQVASEDRFGQRLTDLTAIPGSSRLLATDEGRHELLVLEARSKNVSLLHRLPICPYPVSIHVDPNGKQASIASLWSRRLTVVSLNSDLPKIKQVIDLPFAPRAQLLLPGRGKLLVADAFAGKLAIIDAQTFRIDAIREIPGHNIRGLGVSQNGEMLLVSHQMLNDLAHSIRNDIHWGLLMSNDLRWLKVDSVLTGGDHLYRGGHMHPLGDSGRGGGDPGPLAIAADDNVVVTISGVNEVAFGKEGDFSMQRVKVGRRPTAVKLSADGTSAFIANTFDDSISVLSLAERSITATISLGTSPDLSLTQRGELLFYDARLSHDGWMSCHSCHTDGHANGQMNDNFSDRSFGAAKRVLSLLDAKDTLPLSWTGQVQTFERQIHNSVENTMQREDTLPSEDVTAIAAYLKTLKLPPPLDDLRGTRDPAAIERGRLVFDRRNCATCHAPPHYTSSDVYDVGLRDSQGAKEFNPPTLRGASHRGPFFHDSRASTLEDVFQNHGHPNDFPYSRDEVRDLSAFLRSL